MRNIVAPQRSHTTGSSPGLHEAFAGASDVRTGFGMKLSFPGSGMVSDYSERVCAQDNCLMAERFCLPVYNFNLGLGSIVYDLQPLRQSKLLVSAS